jgi:hypothetical protein
LHYKFNVVFLIKYNKAAMAVTQSLLLTIRSDLNGMKYDMVSVHYGRSNHQSSSFSLVPWPTME